MHRVLIVGGGSIGERHARCFINSGRAEVSLCESRPERRREMAEKYALAGTFEDFDRVDLSGFDAAVICVPANLHVPLALRAVQAGLHVLIEKPLSVSMEGVDELERTSQEKELTVGVAFVRRAMPVHQLARDVLDVGRIGKVLDVVCTVGYDHRAARPDYRQTYEVHRAMGGGVINDVISHLANLIQWHLGPVRDVTTWCENLVLEDMDAEDTVTMLLRFKETRATATVHCSMWQAGRIEHVTFAGTDGTIFCDLFAGKVGVFLRERNEWDWKEADMLPRDSKGQADAPFMTEAENFMDALEGKATVLCTLEEAAHTLRVCIAATRSGEAGRTVPV